MPRGAIAAATWDQRGGIVWSRMFWDIVDALHGVVAGAHVVRPGPVEDELESLAQALRGFRPLGPYGLQDTQDVRRAFRIHAHSDRSEPPPHRQVDV